MKQPLRTLIIGLGACLLLTPSLLSQQEAKEAAADRCSELRKAGGEDAESALGLFEAELQKAPNDLRCGSDYRRLILSTEAYDRGIEFFEGLVAEHPEAPNAFLNLGYALVDKIPVEGAITQVLLANTALGHFSKALEMEETWVGYFTRGNSYLFWPAIFGRTALGMEDLEKAVAMSEAAEKQDHHARAWAALGDGHWRLDDVAKAREVWQKGLALFPDNPHLAAREPKSDEDLEAFLETHFDASNRVDTDLAVLWEGGF